MDFASIWIAIGFEAARTQSQERERAKPNHIRIVTNRGKRGAAAMARGEHGQSRTLCGAEVTSYDLLTSVALRDPSWIRCETCREWLQRKVVSHG